MREDGRVLAARGSNSNALPRLEESVGSDGVVHFILQCGVETLTTKLFKRLWALEYCTRYFAVAAVLNGHDSKLP